MKESTVIRWGRKKRVMDSDAIRKTELIKKKMMRYDKLMKERKKIMQ